MLAEMCSARALLAEYLLSGTPHFRFAPLVPIITFCSQVVIIGHCGLGGEVLKLADSLAARTWWKGIRIEYVCPLQSGKIERQVIPGAAAAGLHHNNNKG